MMHTKYVHVWFMSQYIDYGDYEFSNEWLVDEYYCECYNALMKSCDPEMMSRACNRDVSEFMMDWYRYDPGQYQEALGLTPSRQNTSSGNIMKRSLASKT